MPLKVIIADYSDPQQANHIVMLLDQYAQDPMGGEAPLSAYTRENLVNTLSQLPHAFSILAYVDGQPVGLVNCFEGFSTFACKPLVNIHDVTVIPQFRGKGISRAMLEAVESEAKHRGCCKLTLEVLSNNHVAKAVYQRLGFQDYELTSSAGTALFWQKAL